MFSIDGLSAAFLAVAIIVVVEIVLFLGLFAATVKCMWSSKIFGPTLVNNRFANRFANRFGNNADKANNYSTDSNIRGNNSSSANSNRGNNSTGGTGGGSDAKRGERGPVKRTKETTLTGNKMRMYFLTVRREDE
jgi:uncharacterized membrane protein YgcG